MPLDSMGVSQLLFSQREFFRRAQWQLKFVVWPQRCYLSGNRIWLSQAYRGTRVITGPGEPVHEHRWLTKESFIVAALRGKIK
jgi:hypothetical protein